MIMLLRYLDYIKRQLVFLLFMIPSMIIAIFLKNKSKYKDIWLIAERNDEARDNGYHFFRYVREKHPHINAYYVIDKNAVDRKKVEMFGNIINYGSWKHYIYYALCTKSISSHFHGAAPLGRACFILYKYMPVRKKTVFLNHGVEKDYDPEFSREASKIDIFVCSAKAEYEFVCNSYDYMLGEVQGIGLCRFDQLKDNKPRNYILVMPTFRRWLYNIGRFSKDKAERLFMEEDFFISYHSLLNNSRLMGYLEQQNLKLIFYPHYRIHEFLHIFKSDNERVIIADRFNYDVQKLLKDAAILITDFSSVFFDFAYMRKPVIYYQFDEQRYRKEHYTEGYFNYRLHGFGPVFDSQEDVIDYLEKIGEGNNTIEKEYHDRVEEFFLFNDNMNTKRNFDAINKL